VKLNCLDPLGVERDRESQSAGGSAAHLVADSERAAAVFPFAAEEIGGRPGTFPWLKPRAKLLGRIHAHLPQSGYQRLLEASLPDPALVVIDSVFAQQLG